VATARSLQARTVMVFPTERPMRAGRSDAGTQPRREETHQPKLPHAQHCFQKLYGARVLLRFEFCPFAHEQVTFHPDGIRLFLELHTEHGLVDAVARMPCRTRILSYYPDRFSGRASEARAAPSGASRLPPDYRLPEFGCCSTCTSESIRLTLDESGIRSHSAASVPTPSSGPSLLVGCMRVCQD